MRWSYDQRVDVLPARSLRPLTVPKFLLAAEVRPQNIVNKKVCGSVYLLRSLVRQNRRRR